MELTTKEKSTLLDIVKKTIAAKINNKKLPKLTVDSETLKEKRGAFVTKSAKLLGEVPKR